LDSTLWHFGLSVRGTSGVDVEAEANSGSVLAFPTLVAAEFLHIFKLGRKRILDTHLAAIFHLAGIKRFITSNPSDFEVFKVFEFVAPR
jgi:hypothetical protein